MKDPSIFETYVDLHYVTKVTFLGKAKNATLGNKRNNFFVRSKFLNLILNLTFNF